MVEEWNIGDEFIVVEDRKGYWLNKEDKGKVYLVDIPNIYFTNDLGKAINVNRIQKINNQRTYELW